jgi:DNA-binding response OmpR family regulator
LLTGGELVVLGPRAFDMLIALVERAGRLVIKEELLDRVRPKLVIEEHNLQVQISALGKIPTGAMERSALIDAAHYPFLAGATAIDEGLA